MVTSRRRLLPDSVQLPSGRALAAGGLSNLIAYVIAGNAQNNQFEIFDGERLVERNKFRTLDQYPIITVLPSTQLLFVHSKRDTYFFDLRTRLFWQRVCKALFEPRSPIKLILPLMILTRYTPVVHFQSRRSLSSTLLGSLAMARTRSFKHEQD
jgi:hypothetical protein